MNGYSTPEAAGARDADFVQFDPPTDRPYRAVMTAGKFDKFDWAGDTVFCVLSFRLDDDESLPEDIREMVTGQLVNTRWKLNERAYQTFCRRLGADPRTINLSDYVDMPAEVMLRSRAVPVKDDEGNETDEERVFVNVADVRPIG